MSYHHVRVMPYEAVAGQWEDEKAPAIFDEVIAVDPSEIQPLEKQLDVLAGANLIGDWSIEPYNPLVAPGDTETVIDSIIVHHGDDEPVYSALEEAGLI